MCSNLPDGCSMNDIDRRFQTQSMAIVRKAQRAEKLKKDLENCLHEAKQVFFGEVSDTVGFLPDCIEEVTAELERLDKGQYDLEDEWRAASAPQLEAAE